MKAAENPINCNACPELIRLQVRVSELEKDSATHNADIRALLEAGLSMLMNLSIGGGALSIINLIVLLFILAGRITNAGY